MADFRRASRPEKVPTMGGAASFGRTGGAFDRALDKMIAGGVGVATGGIIQVKKRKKATTKKKETKIQTAPKRGPKAAKIQTAPSRKKK